MKAILKRAWNHLEGINGLVLTLYMAFVYFTDAVVGGKGSAMYWVVALLVGGAVSAVACPVVIRYLSRVGISTEKEKCCRNILIL